MMNNTQNQWDLNYDDLHDYLAFNTQDINSIFNSISTSAPKTLLDIGCGTGQVGREFYHRGYQTLGIDGSVKAITIANAATVHKDIIYTHSSFEEFLQRTEKSTAYGLIICKYVFAFVNDRNFFLSSIKKLLDQSGTFVLVTPDIEKLPAEKTSIAIPHEEMKTVLGDHFEITHYIRGRDYYYLCRNVDS